MEMFLNTWITLKSMSLEQITAHETKTGRFLAKNLEPAMAWTLANAAYLKLSDEALKIISQNTGNLEEIATIGAYGVLGTGIFYANKKLFNPLAKKIKSWKEKQIGQGLDYAREKRKNAVQLAAITALFFATNMPGTLSNYKADLGRAANVFTKKEQIRQAMPNEYDSLGLEGRTLNSLFSLYTGVPESATVGKTISVDFNEQLSQLWSMKKERSKGNSVIDEVISSQVKKYVNTTPTRMTFTEYLAEANKAIEDTKKNLDWEIVARNKRLSKRQLGALKKVSGSIGAEEIMSYALTELMPSHNGSLNIDVMDFLLRNAGREYVELIPALFDSKTSFGPYQFTPHALHDDERDIRGASIINRALPEQERIPGSVKLLQGNDHHKAAYLFAINNLADLIRNTSEKQLKTLEDYSEFSSEGIVKYVGTAHHRPRDALRAGKRWLGHDARYAYSVSCSGPILEYSRKTRENHEAITGMGRLASR